MNSYKQNGNIQTTGDQHPRRPVSNVKNGKRRKKRRPPSFYIACVILFVLSASIISGALLIGLSVSMKAKAPRASVTYVMETLDSTGAGTVFRSERHRASTVYRNGVFFTGISDIAALYGLTYSQNGSTYKISGSNEAVFFAGSCRYTLDGNDGRMSETPFEFENQLYVPCNVFTLLLRGFSYSYDSNQSVLTLTRDTRNEADGIFSSPSLAPAAQINEGSDTPADPDTPTPEDPGTPDPPAEPSKPEFVSNLDAYEQYMNPGTTSEYLMLINSSVAPLSSGFIPDDLIDVADTRQDGRATQKLRLYAEKSLEAFLTEARANGCKNVTVTSAYRSYAYQEYLFNNYVSNEMNGNTALTRAQAEAIVVKYSSRAGTSEHQTGLSCDMHNMASAQTSFGKTDEAKWLAENAHKFGFILRYPADKTNVTGISYEPWHFRYVGRYHATRIYEAGLCLEEYVDQYIRETGSAEVSADIYEAGRD